jgi:hypothetical protein
MSKKKILKEDTERVVSVYLYKDLRAEIENMMQRIIRTQNKILIRQIAVDFNRDGKAMVIKYRNGEYF